MTAFAPLDSLRERYAELLDLCDAVESIIDSIAGRMDLDLCMATAARISTVKLGRAVEMQWPSRETGPEQAQPDRELPDQLAAALHAAACGRSTFSWQAIDSMLRVILDELRRHIAAEQAMLDAIGRSKVPH